MQKITTKSTQAKTEPNPVLVLRTEQIQETKIQLKRWIYKPNTDFPL